MNEINELFEEYDDNFLCVSDFNITIKGTQVDYICNTDGSVQIWAGNPLADDNYAEELVLTPSEREYVFNQILKYL